MKKEPQVTIKISAETSRTLKLISIKQGFKTPDGHPSRAQAVEYLIKNFEAPIV